MTGPARGSRVLVWVAAVTLAWSAAGCSALKVLLPRDGTKEERVKRLKSTMTKTAKGYLGTRYRMGGTTRKGMDCSGLMLRVYESAGIKLPHSAEEQYRVGRSIHLSSMQFGDLMFFNTKRFQNRPCTTFCSWTWTTGSVPLMYGLTHTGMYMGDGTFIHASTSSGVTRAKVEDDYWQARLISVRRVLENFDD